MRQFLGSLLPRGLSPPRAGGPPPVQAPPMSLPAPVPQALAGAMTPRPPLGTVTPLPPGTGLADVAATAVGGLPAAQFHHFHQQPGPVVPPIELTQPSPPAGVAASPVDQSMRLVMEGLAAQSRVLTALARGTGAETGDLADADPLQSGSLAGMSTGRAATLMAKWRIALQTAPDSILQRVRSNRNLAMQGAAVVPGAAPTYRNFLSNEVPFGKARTAAYLMFALADVLDLLEAGKPKEAEALGAMVLAAGEQAALQGWTWSVAWTMAFVPEPPWQRIGIAPTPEHARIGSKLVDPSLLAAAVTRYQQTTTLLEAQRKATAQSPYWPPARPSASTDAAADDHAAAGAGAEKAPRKGRRPRGGRGPAAAASAEEGA